MGMTIDEAITVLGMVEAHGICIEAKDIAIDAMRKYKQIEQIRHRVKHTDLEPAKAYELINEVLEDGKID